MGQKKGYKQSEEHKRRKAESLKIAHAEGRHSGGFKKGKLGYTRIGTPHTDEWKKAQSERMKQNNPMKNADVAKRAMETRRINGSQAGENNHNWKGGRPKYRGADWQKQRKLALQRDNYTCQKCGKLQSDLRCELSVHHIVPYHDGGGNDLPNLVTVCVSCHFSLEPR